MKDLLRVVRSLANIINTRFVLTYNDLDMTQFFDTCYKLMRNLIRQESQYIVYVYHFVVFAFC